MTQKLSVEIVHLEGSMVDVLILARDRGGHEKCVVVDGVLATVDAAEKSNFLARNFARGRVDFFSGDVENIGGVDVEVSSVPVHLIRKILDVDPEVAELETCQLGLVWENVDGKIPYGQPLDQAHISGRP